MTAQLLTFLVYSARALLNAKLNRCFRAWKEWWEEGERKPALRLVRRHDFATLLGSLMASASVTRVDQLPESGRRLASELSVAVTNVLGPARRILELHCDGALV